MLGNRKARQENLFGPVKRETRVSKELKAVRKLLDLGWFRDRVKDKFCLENGRPSIAPETLVAMMFLGYWFHITSDRELCEECEDRLSFREFIGISDEDEIPVHSSLTHWRQRLGREVFQELIMHTLELANRHGLRPGACRLFDSSLVKAQADAMGPATVKLDPAKDANDYLEALGEWNQEEEQTRQNGSKGGGADDRHGRKRHASGREIRVNTHDLDAKFLTRRGKKPDFYHKVHFEFDSKTGLVMNADAGHVGECEKMVEFLSNEKAGVDTVGGDTGYFSAKSQVWLKEAGITSFISVRDRTETRGTGFGLEAFHYISERDEYICPAGVRLSRQNRGSDGEKRYASPRGSCVGCEYACHCFQNGKPADRRQLGLSADRWTVEEAKRRNLSHRYLRIMKRRSIVCEGGIGTMKNYGALSRARAAGEEAAAIQAAFAGAVLNIGKILRYVMRENASISATFSGVTHFLYQLMRQVLGALSVNRPGYIWQANACAIRRLRL
jgi:IS5 family transposase